MTDWARERAAALCRQNGLPHWGSTCGSLEAALDEAAARATAAELERLLAMLREPSEAMVEAMRHADLHGDGLLYPRLLHALADYIEAEAQPTAGEETRDG